MTRRRFTLACGVGALLATVLFAVVLQGGRDGLLHDDLVGNFYDGQARALLDGHLDVDPSIPGFEGFVMEDGTHIYQGLTPALARIPLLVVTDRFDGRLTGVSMVLGLVAALVAASVLGWRVRRALRGAAPVGLVEWICTAAAVMGIGAAPLLFLTSRSWVYHEALVWGAACALGSFAALAWWVTSPRDRPALGPLSVAVVAAALGINTRTSIGLGPLAALGLVTGLLVVHAVAAKRPGTPVERVANWFAEVSGRCAVRPRPWRSVVVVVGGVVAAMVLYSGVNLARFDSLFSVPLDKQSLVAIDPARTEALEANGNSLFGLGYTPSVLWQALRPDGLRVNTEFPYTSFPTSRPTVIGDAVFAELDWSSSLPAAAPLAVLASLVGVVALVLPRRMLGPAGRTGRGAADTDTDTETETDTAAAALRGLRVPAIGAAVSGAAVLVFGYMAQRYLVDMYPILTLASLVGLQVLVLPSDAMTPGRTRAVLRSLLAFAVLVGSAWACWVGVSLALQFRYEVGPGVTDADRASWLDRQLGLGSAPTYVPLGVDEPLPEPDQLGELAVVGECDGLYRSNGTVWYVLEGGPATGGARLSVRGATDPGWSGSLRVAGTVDGEQRSDLVLERTDQDRYRFALVTRVGDLPEARQAGPTFTLEPDRERELLVTMDWRTGAVEVAEPTSWSDALLYLRTDLPEAPVEYEPTSSGDGPRIGAALPATPVCDRLTRSER